MKTQPNQNTIKTLLSVPKALSLKLARLIIDRAEKGQKVTKENLIIEYIEKGIKEEAS